MSLCDRCVPNASALQLLRAPLAVTTTVATIIAVGCGGGMSATTPTLSGNTTVVLMASSTANAQLTGFEAQIESLTLTGQTGNQVTLISSPTNEEFIHLNGTVEPLATISIPQGIYVSATATASNMEPVCSGQAPGLLYSDPMHDTSSMTVNLPSPITVSGNVMGLVLNLDASQSTPFTGACPLTTVFPPGVTSVLNLTPMTIAAQPTNSANGMAFGLRGIIASVASGGSSLTVNSLSSAFGDSPDWTFSVNSATTLQGGLTAAQLVAGAVIDIDVAVQQDGSLLATRVALIDADLPNLTVASGSLLSVPASIPVILANPTTQEGALNLFPQSPWLNFGSSNFQISSQIENLSTLPFTASFNASNMVAGQKILVSTQATSTQGVSYIPLLQIMLIPQTINGKVIATSSQGNFTTYTVQLAPYDPFPTFAVELGQTTLLTAPDTVVVYADSKTQMLKFSSIGEGSLVRFYGLVFNDNGTLRMDCTQIDDGVAE